MKNSKTVGIDGSSARCELRFERIGLPHLTITFLYLSCTSIPRSYRRSTLEPLHCSLPALYAELCKLSYFIQTEFTNKKTATANIVLTLFLSSFFFFSVLYFTFPLTTIRPFTVNYYLVLDHNKDSSAFSISFAGVLKKCRTM